MHIFKNTHYDFLRWRWYAIVLSWVVILSGIAVMATRGIPKGVEFSGGTIVIVQFDQPTSIQQVRSALGTKYGQNAIVQAFGSPALHQVMIRLPQVGAESGGSLSSTKQEVVDALSKANAGKFDVVGTQIIGPAVGRELTSKGIWATVLSLGGILVYIAFRYQMSFAVGAVIATVHDLMVTLAFLAFFRYDLSLNVIAAILTVTGYSTNDTIVIFDRVRENLRLMRREPLNLIINTSVNQTLSRTVITAGTTLLSAIALFVFGGEVLRGFAFTMIVGVITGTYSSVFVAAAVVSLWRGSGPTKAAAHAPASVAERAAAQQQPTRRSKPQRKVRAS
ncbi:MAG: protein translocase subunit SecF [Betaproteobacteria bacterium]